MNDPNRSSAADSGLFVESDSAETEFSYGDGRGPYALSVVAFVWIGFAIGMAAYLYLYYFPDLAEWSAWAG